MEYSLPQTVFIPTRCQHGLCRNHQQSVFTFYAGGQRNRRLCYPQNQMRFEPTTSSLSDGGNAFNGCYRILSLQSSCQSPIRRGPSRKVKIATICSLWLIPAVICIPTFTGFKIQNGECIHQPVLSNKIHLIIRFVLNFVVPYIVMLASYGAVAWNLRKRMKQKAAKTRKSIIPSATAAVEIEEPVELQDVAEKKDKEEDLTEDRRRKVLVDLGSRRCSKPEKTDLEEDLLKMIYAIILIFVVCYFPYQANFLWEYIADINSWQFRYHYLLQNYLFILTCLPNALHPVCYGTMSSFYAMAFAKIFFVKSIKMHITQVISNNIMK